MHSDLSNGHVTCWYSMWRHHYGLTLETIDWDQRGPSSSFVDNEKPPFVSLPFTGSLRWFTCRIYASCMVLICFDSFHVHLAADGLLSANETYCSNDSFVKMYHWLTLSAETGCAAEKRNKHLPVITVDMLTRSDQRFKDDLQRFFFPNCHGWSAGLGLLLLLHVRGLRLRPLFWLSKGGNIWDMNIDVLCQTCV